MRIDRPGVALLDEQRYAAGVIDVRMTNDDRVNALRVNRERIAVVGLFFRRTITAPAAAIQKVMETNITKVKSWTKVPVRASRQAQIACRMMARSGVRLRGWTRPACLKKSPSRAMA